MVLLEGKQKDFPYKMLVPGKSTDFEAWSILYEQGNAKHTKGAVLEDMVVKGREE